MGELVLGGHRDDDIHRTDDVARTCWRVDARRHDEVEAVLGQSRIEGVGARHLVEGDPDAGMAPMPRL